MKLPTEQQCQGYFKEYVVPLNIVSHCHKVREVANFIAKKMKESGQDVNLEFVNRLALMHDLFKVVAIPELKPSKFHKYEFTEQEIAMANKLKQKYPNMYESEVAYLVFKDEFPELANSLKNMSDPKIENKLKEEMIVNYADWRVIQKKVISLAERIAYLKEFYPGEEVFWQELMVKMLQLENEIMSAINIDPTKLGEKIAAVKNG